MANVGITVVQDLIAFLAVIGIFIGVLNILLKFARDEFNKKRPRQKEDAFKKENGYSWNYVFVYKVYDEDDEATSKLTRFQEGNSMQNVIDALLRSGNIIIIIIFKSLVYNFD
jgi:hypothetical protein